MSEEQTIAYLRRLDEIGGWVSEDEVRYQLGEDAPLDLFEAEGDGLVITRTDFTLTSRGECVARHMQPTAPRTEAR